MNRNSTVWMVVLCAALAASLASCAETAPQQPSGEPLYTIVRPPEQESKAGGIPPDKEAEIQLLLQQRETSARRCYQDVLNEKHDRAFQGSVKVLISIQTSGKASAVKIAGGTLNDKDVHDCLIELIKDFEFPQLAAAGDVQYEFRFRPQY